MATPVTLEPTQDLSDPKLKTGPFKVLSDVIRWYLNAKPLSYVPHLIQAVALDEATHDFDFRFVSLATRQVLPKIRRVSLRDAQLVWGDPIGTTLWLPSTLKSDNPPPSYVQPGEYAILFFNPDRIPGDWPSDSTAAQGTGKWPKGGGGKQTGLRLVEDVKTYIASIRDDGAQLAGFRKALGHVLLPFPTAGVKDE